uniref:RB_A domain-containing protein n=1 Tax=Macrostomum lignano TaxID=282301 RepID=A0A1I8FGS2_9PLAT
AQLQADGPETSCATRAAGHGGLPAGRAAAPAASSSCRCRPTRPSRQETASTCSFTTSSGRATLKTRNPPSSGFFVDGFRDLLLETRLPLSDDEGSDGEDPDVDSAAVGSPPPPALIGNNNIYALLRLYQLLCKRLAAAKSACDAAAAAATSGDSTGSDSTAVALRLRAAAGCAAGPAVRALHAPAAARAALGVQNYELFTLDKLVALAAFASCTSWPLTDSAKQLLRACGALSSELQAAPQEEYNSGSWPSRTTVAAAVQSFSAQVDHRISPAHLQLMRARQQPPPSPPPEPAPSQRLPQRPPPPLRRTRAPDVAALREVPLTMPYKKQLLTPTAAPRSAEVAVSDDRAAPDRYEQTSHPPSVSVVANASASGIRLAKATQAGRAQRGAEEAELPADADCQPRPTLQERQRVQWQRDILSLLRATFLVSQARTSELFQGVTYWDQMEDSRSQRARLRPHVTPPAAESVFYRSGQLPAPKATHRPSPRLSGPGSLIGWPAKQSRSGWLGTRPAGVGAWARAALRTTGLRLRTSRIMLSPASTGTGPYTPITANRTVVEQPAPARRPPPESLTTERQDGD